jgi:hypothetical protein
MAEAHDGAAALVLAEPDKLGIRCSRLWSERIADVRIESGLAALRDFDAALDRLGSKRESVVFGLMSASTDCRQRRSLCERTASC